MERTMKRARMPSKRYVDRLAKFWDTHDISELEHELIPIREKLFDLKATRRRVIEHWIRRGKYAVLVKVNVAYLLDNPSMPRLEPKTAKWLDEVARKAEAGDIKYLRKVGRVYQLVAS